MYYKTAPTDALELLIDKVETCFNNYHLNKLNHIVWLTLQSCMNEIIEDKGDNKYKIPHSHEQRKIRKIELTAYLYCCNTGSTQL
jgi:hypothetical protein